MEEMTLSTKECLLAAAKTGAKKFFGLPDAFLGMTAAEIRQEREELQLSMEKRGYAEVGFDNAFVLKPAAAELIGLCTGCDSYLLAQYIVPGNRKRQLVLYAGQDGFACARLCGDDVTLGRAEESVLPQMLLEEVRPTASGSAPPVSARVKQEDLARVQHLAMDDPASAAEGLTGRGCPAQIAAVLVQGFRMEAGRFAFFRTDLQKRTLRQMIVLQSGDGAVCMTLADEDEDLWDAQYLPDGVTAEVLEPLCPRKGEGHEVQ